MPLWSNVLINTWTSYFNISIKRLTNNPVENWFDQIKESLKQFSPVMPSQFANFVYSLVEALYEQYPIFKSIKLNKDSTRESTENWSKMGSQSFRRDKNAYNKLKTLDNKDVFDNHFKGF